mgnify:CR=1 FL=1
MSDLQGRVAIVTGGSQGIGLAYAKGLAAHGATVVIADLRGAEDAAAAIGVRGVTVDVTDAQQVAEAVSSVQREYARIDILVNNAAFYGGLSLASFEDITEADWDKSMAVNVKGVWLMAKAVAPIMRAQGSGRIINIASNVVFMGKPNFLHYVASKGAVWAMTNALSRELAGSSVTVNCVAPGYTITPATREMGTPEQVRDLESQIIDAQSVKRLLEPEDMVGAVLYLASDAAAMVTGQTIVVDGGVIVG